MIPLAPRIKSIHLLPVGDDISLGFLDDLAASLAHVFTVSCHVRDVRLDAESARDPLRNQYHSTAILRDLVPLVAEKDGLRLVGVTEYDLFVPVLTFVFGEAQLDGACALVSLHRLREEFYGLDPNPDLLLDRALKEAVHELGHTFGLRHCPDWRCVMASTHSVERLDLKQAQFCASCARVVAQGW